MQGWSMYRLVPDLIHPLHCQQSRDKHMPQFRVSVGEMCRRIDLCVPEFRAPGSYPWLTPCPPEAGPDPGLQSTGSACEPVHATAAVGGAAEAAAAQGQALQMGGEAAGFGGGVNLRCSNCCITAGGWPNQGKSITCHWSRTLGTPGRRWLWCSAFAASAAAASCKLIQKTACASAPANCWPLLMCRLHRCCSWRPDHQQIQARRCTMVTGGLLQGRHLYV